ncbi:MAG: zinc-ribbon domain-containing protein [Firmicutes bacterium]|nr:zinc-ribbon domain-containing protein [Bacillota bacterium]
MEKFIKKREDLLTWCKNNNRQDLIDQYSTKNEISMEELSYGSKTSIIWCLPYDTEDGKHFDFEWEQAVKDRTGEKQLGCPYLSGKAVWIGYNDLVTTHYDLVNEWHPLKNKNLQPSDFTYGSHQKIWWHKSYFDPVTHKMVYLQWEQSIKARTLRNLDCPLLSGSSLERFVYEYLLKRNIHLKKNMFLMI